jgi:hypothetical protein
MEETQENTQEKPKEKLKTIGLTFSTWMELTDLKNKNNEKSFDATIKKLIVKNLTQQIKKQEVEQNGTNTDGM